MKNFFKKLWKKLKGFLGWLVFLIGLTIYILYDVLYQSNLQWRIFFERLPLFLALAAAGIAGILIMKKKGAFKNHGKKDGTDAASADSGDEKSGRDDALNAPFKEEEKTENEKNDRNVGGSTDGSGAK